MRKTVFIFCITCIAIFALVACQASENNDSQLDDDYAYEDQDAIKASSVSGKVEVPLMNSDGLKVAIATLSEEYLGNGVQIILEGDRLPPGEHGFHIHDAGECVPPDFASAGSHYNPTRSAHGFNHPDGPHAGDLENIIVGVDGSVYVELEAPMVTLQPEGENTLFTEEGTTLIIHANPDDYISQPTGNAGDRIACGVIK